jgi:hypothetical protein
MDIREIGWGGINWIDLAQDRDHTHTHTHTHTHLFTFHKSTSRGFLWTQ